MMPVHDPKAEQTLRDAVRTSMLKRKEMKDSISQGGWSKEQLEFVEQERKSLEQLAKDLGYKSSELDSLRKDVAKEVLPN